MSSNNPMRPVPLGARLVRGVSLIELMVAITIGAILIFGATQVYVDSRKTYEISETAARLQETARYALSVLEPDIRMSNYWGLVKGAHVIGNQDTVNVGGASSCGADYARSLIANLEGSNNAYGFTCTATTGGAVASADTLTVRRASTTTAAAGSGRLQICSTRMMGMLVTDSTACTAVPDGQINDLMVHGYYVAKAAVATPTVPALRRWTLISGPAFRDDEIIPGVEDLQVQFGIDPTGTRGIASRYVNPGAVPTDAQIVSVRLWVLVRSEQAEVGFTDDRIYEYGDRDQDNGITADLSATTAATAAYQPNDNFRRLLVSRTIQIRNALGT
jgi:type IV pilus assembly protein PilW